MPGIGDVLTSLGNVFNGTGSPADAFKNIMGMVDGIVSPILQAIDSLQKGQGGQGDDNQAAGAGGADKASAAGGGQATQVWQDVLKAIDTIGQNVLG